MDRQEMIGESKICAVVAAESAAAMWRQLKRALAETKTIELRLDWLANDGEIERFLARLAANARGRGGRGAGPTFVATCRRREAGGRYRGTIAKQLVHLGAALRAGCAWYDLEIESASCCPAELVDVLLGEGRQICSAHFFQRGPKDFNRVVAALSSVRPDAIKIAAQCESLSEARRVMAIAHGRRDVIAVPMGDVALPMRVLGLREGRNLVYAPVENATAPGQVSLDEMKNLYRADRINRRTRVYGVIGDPIGHSLSPQMQNAGFQARGMNAVYLPFLVRDLKDFCDSIEPLGIRGFSVTLPHKEAILALSRRLRSARRSDRSREYGGRAGGGKLVRLQHGLRGCAARTGTPHAAARQPRADPWRGRSGARGGVCAFARRRIGWYLCAAGGAGKRAGSSGRRARQSGASICDRNFSTRL